MLGSAKAKFSTAVQVLHALRRPRTKRFVGSNQLLLIDYHVNPLDRYSGGRNSTIERMCVESRAAIEENVELILSHLDALLRIPADATDSAHWNNRFFSGLDAAALYSLISYTKPRRFIEIGSGNSTMFARRAISDANLQTHVTSIDPFPRASIDKHCDEIIRRPFEELRLDDLGEVTSQDILFLDGSHRVFQNSDTTAFFMDVLPAMPSGMLIHVHDIYLPFDYPSSIADRFYSEQYLLAAWLMGRNSRITMPCAWVLAEPHLRSKLDLMWAQIVKAGATMPIDAASFWFRL